MTKNSKSLTNMKWEASTMAGRSFKKTKRAATTFENIPRELLGEILGRVASDSFTDVFNAKLRCPCEFSFCLASGTKAKKWNAKKKKKGKNKVATVATNIQKKTKPEKGKCFHCGEDGHWKRNCPKYLASLPVKSGKAPNQGIMIACLLETCLVGSPPGSWCVDS
ncbi:hypothetical protein BUALT_Bualt17G0070500 [Buddleja alternifolia]|uniref:CCHC-type domain-containing protein n=1 Tax=Buddleja alternifolia TaxID=168488 RepID=A0AAV6W877_9LAMI|nr:hypothetical protein BUALT_Bualt17G0070500 [Buddleja alternifolia]